MGSATFVHTRTSEKTAEEAFKAAREEALYNHGHSGYSGTIAEKHKFIMLPMRDDMNLEETVWHYLRKDARVEDKFGPAGCIKTEDGFTFFGWASC